MERVSRVPFSLCSTTSGGPSVHVLGHCEGAKAWFVWHGDLLCGGIFFLCQKGKQKSMVDGDDGWMGGNVMYTIFLCLV